MKPKTYSRGFYVWLSCYLLWIGVIFFLSSQPYSKQSLIPMMQESFNENTFQSWLPQWKFEFGSASISYVDPYLMIEFFIRKASHIGAFMIMTLLGFAVFRYVFQRWIPILVVSSCIALAYAFFDEWHQTWTPNRTGQLLDVFIDLIGIVLANSIVLCVVGIQYLRKRKQRL